MKRARLPDGREVYEDRSRMSDMIHSQILEYFRHGIDVQPGCTVLDVGANTGLFTLEVLQRCAGDARIYCIEPAPHIGDILQCNVNEHFPDAPVKLVRGALGATPRQGTLYYVPRAPVVSSIFADQVKELEDSEFWIRLARDPHLPPEYRRYVPRWAAYVPKFLLRAWVKRFTAWTLTGVEQIPCQVQTVSQLIREEGIEQVDLLKVDVEGAELEVLEGIDAADWARIRSAVIEIQDIEQRRESIEALLRSHGLTNLVAEQEYIFRGSHIWNLYACRP